jgi:hypothetical protein
MLGAEVTGLTLVYAEKVKFIAFTFPAPHRGRAASTGSGTGGDQHDGGPQ